MKFSRECQTATLLPNGKVLVAGGSATSLGITLATAELYTPDNTTRWTGLNPGIIQLLLQ
jgi:hypothetical protein